MFALRPLDASAPPARLSAAQLRTVLIWGLMAWLIAALTIRWIPGAFAGGPVTAAMFVFGALLAWPLVSGVERAAGLRPDQRVTGVALASAAAMLADGLGLVWSPIYAAAGVAPLAAAAWLLWGVAWLMIVAAARR